MSFVDVLILLLHTNSASIASKLSWGSKF